MIERNIHYINRSKHIRGEWFDLKEDDLPTLKQSIQFSGLLDYDLKDWSLERKSCDEFTADVCKKARRALGLSEAELAERANLSASTVSGFEPGSSTPQLGTIEAIKNALENEGVEFIPVQAGKPLKVLV